MIKVVLDTNVLISAVISEGKSRQLLQMGLENRYIIVMSDLILNEFVRVLRRPKFKASEEEIHSIVLALIRSSEVVDVVSRFRAIKADPKDNMIIETAFDGRATLIASGDNHLLELGEFMGIKIRSVEDTINFLESSVGI